MASPRPSFRSLRVLIPLTLLPFTCQADVTPPEVYVKSFFVDLTEFPNASDSGTVRMPMSQSQLSVQVVQAGNPDSLLRVRGRMSSEDAPFLDPSVYGTENISCYQGPVIHDIHGNELVNHVASMHNQSVGWTGDVQTSGYERHRITIPVPEKAHYLSFIMSSGQEAPANLGVVALRRCILTLVPREQGKPPVILDLLDDEHGNDRRWVRHGSKLEMSTITTNEANGSALLLVEDHHAEKWAGWVSEHVGINRMREVVVEWEAACSMGLPYGLFRYTAGQPGHPKAGRHEFEIQPTTLYGLPTGDVITVPFYVEAPFYQTTLFRVVVGALVILAGIGAVRAVTKARMQRKLNVIERQRAVEQERARIARDLHDHLGADLTQLAMLSDLLQQPQGTPTANRERLDQLFELAQGMTRQVDEIVWTVNPEHDSLRGLLAYLTTHMQQYLAAAGLRCRLRLPEVLPEVEITSARRHHLLMVVKEVLHNVVKHAQAEEVSLVVSVNDQLTLIITDNGQGLPEQPPAGDGLQNMRERMKQAGGTFEINSAPGKGTSITLNLPLPSPS